MEICLTASQMLEAMLSDVKPDAAKIYRPSIYNQFHTTENGIYVYNVLTRRLARLTEDERNLLQQNAVSCGDDTAQLIAKRFLISMEIDELSHYLQLFSTQELFYSATAAGMKTYRILPTTGCNARCFYCFEQGVQIQNMDDNTADAVIDYIKKTHNPQKEIRLDWFGGEPLLRQATIDRICAGLTVAGVGFYSSMTTNGSLLTPEVIEKAKEHWHLKKVQITLDGEGQTHNARKAYVSFPDAYTHTLNTIDTLVATGVGVTVRMNTDGENLQSIEKLYDHLRARYQPTDPIALDVALLFEQLDDPQLRVHWINLRKRIWEDGFMKLKPLRNELPLWRCIANSESGAIIQPDGTLTACGIGQEELYYGDIRQGITNPALKKKWRCCTDIREKCKTCPYLPECTGFSMCPYEAADCRTVMADTFAYRLAITVRKFEKQ